jgi:hypothetical protein
MGEPSPESAIAKKQGYLAIESWGYKGVALDFMGVYHDPVTFEAYRESLEQQISKNDVVLLEAAPRAEGLMDPSGGIPESVISEMRKTYKVPATEIRKLMGRLKPALDFFAEMERLAGEAGKDVMIFDPYSADPAMTEAKEEMKKVGLQLYALRTAGLM